MSGTWYGTMRRGPPAPQTPTGGGGAPTIMYAYAEVFLDMQQTGNAVTGSGNLCFNLQHVTEEVPFAVSGAVANGAATLHWGSGGNRGTTLALGSTTLSLAVTLVSGQMVLRGTDASGTFAATVQHGTRSQYASACSQLNPFTSGG